MEECESLDSEMTELQEFQNETMSQDDEDEVEELTNSLREVVQDPTVKPKLQCLLVDPSFSMVTVQSEDSGIVWETASSRCSTPWASETGSISDGCSMEGSGGAGKITIVFDEEKIIRRRTRSGGRSSRLVDRLSRPGSSRSASALGVERLEMAEVSLPNVKQEKSETEPDLEDIKNKDQQLFSLISEGYEILNIRVPSKLPTVDEEESTELQDNLSFLDQTPRIKSRNNQDWTLQQNHILPDDDELLDHREPSEEDSPQSSADTELRQAPTLKDRGCDIDYFEKFTLLDVVVPGEQTLEQQVEAEQPAAMPQVEEQKAAKMATDSPSASEDSFVFVTDVDIVEEHLDEVFYGDGAPADALKQSKDEEEEEEEGARIRSRRESQRSGKENGSVLFGSEDTILTPIFLSTGPPKIIDQILLDEPTAMSFMYSDLYEDALGERRKSDEEYSEAESVASEKSYKRRFSDSEDADGYLEKFTLKDETPTVEVEPESEPEEEKDGRMVWARNKFDMTGCLKKVSKSDKEAETKTEEPKRQEISVGERSEELQSGASLDKTEIITETEKETEETQPSIVTEKLAVSEDSVQELKLREDQGADQVEKYEQTGPPESSTDEPLPETQQVVSKVEKTEESEEQVGQVPAVTEKPKAKLPCQMLEEVEKIAQVVVNATEEKAVIAPVISEVPHTVTNSEIPTESTEKSLELATDTTMVSAEEKALAETIAEAAAEVTEPETERQEVLSSIEIEASVEIPLCKGKEVPDDVAQVEVIADCDSAVCAVVEVFEKVVDEKEIQTQVQIDLQEVTSVETTDVQTAAPEGDKEREAITEETAVESQLPDSLPEADQEIEVKTEVSSGVAGTAMLEEVETDSEEKQQEILESKQHPQKESVTHDDLDKTTLVTEAKDKTLTEDTVQEMVHIGDELILRVPKGQAVEMNIEISQGSEKAKCDEPDCTWECLIAPESPTISPGGLQNEKTMTDAQLEVKQEVVLKEEALLTNKLDDRCSLPIPLEEANTESDAVALIGPDSQHECLIAPEKTTECPMVLLPNEETKVDPQLEVKPEVVLKEETLPTNKLDDRCSPLAPLEQANTESDEDALIEPDSTREGLIAPESTTICPGGLLQKEETMADSQHEVKPEVILKEEALPTHELNDRCSPLAPLEQANTESDEVALIEPDSTYECLIAPEGTTEYPMDLLPNKKTMADPQLEVKSEIIVKEALPTNELDDRLSPPVPLEEANTESDAVALIGTDSTREGLIAPESTTICPGGLLQKEETMADSQHEVKPEVILKEEALPTHELNDSCSPPALLEEANTERDAVALSIPDNTYKCLIAPENTTICPGGPVPHEETMADPQLEVIPEVLLKEEVEPTNELPLEEANTEEQKLEQEFEEDEGISSNLRSFTPQEDLFVLGTEAMQSEAASVEQKVEMHTMDDALETIIVKEDSGLEMDLHSQDVGQRMEQDEAVAQAVEEPEYEVISKQDAKEMLERETQRDAEELKVESGLEGEERLEMEIEVEVEVEKEEGVVDLSEEEELIEADYDIIDAEEQSQARLAAELQGMDWFCLTCGCLLSEDDFVSGEHHSHDLTAVDKAHEEIKEKLGDWISELQGRSENIEDLVSELELAYNSVEDQYVETETGMRVQNEEIVALVMEQYNNMSVSMEEEKKAKLEQLYDQIVSFQESIDSAKATLETTSREAETDARSPEDIHARLKVALDSAMSLELGPKGLLVFEDYAKGNTSRCHLAQRKGIPVPQRPTLQPQEPGSATSSSVTVYWKVNPGDIIDCFQVYCMEDPQGAVSEEYRVTVKESYCVLEELDPNKTYKVWVMAVNYTGCSLPSERLAFRTAPSVPVIDTERCTVMWDSAMLRWSSAEHTTEQSCTLEYCRQYELEGEGLRSISGIKSCEHRVVLQPNENYLFYIKAVNEAGASEQSEAALISTKGTRFRLLKASAHPALELSVDENTLHYSQEDAHKQCPCILGELLPARGHHYWETIVSGSTAYRLGVAVNRNSPLGENSLSWCLQCIPTQSGCRYQLLHNGVQSSVFVIETPERVGTLLDYQHGRLSFYNAQSGQLLGTFCQRFTQPCHPALGLEMRGSLEISMVLEVPEFTKDS